MKKIILFLLLYIPVIISGQAVINLDKSSLGTLDALLEANMSMIWVSQDNTTGVETGSFIYPFNTIQEGLDAAIAGNVVIVLETSDGSSYDEHLVMETANVRLMTLEGQTVEIVLQSSGAIGLDLGANGIIVGGGSGSGFTISQDAGLMIVMDADRSDVEVSYNKIVVDDGGTIGVNIGAAGATRFKMKNNLFLVDSAMGGFFAVKSLDDVEIIDNEFQGADTSSSYAIQMSGFLNGIIAGNYIHRGATVAGGFASGIFPHTNTSDPHSSDSLEIYNNIVQDCSNGIRLGHSNGADMKEVYVYGNILQHNTRGIFVHNDAQVFPATYDIYDNSFSDNEFDVVNDHATALNLGLNSFDALVGINDAAPGVELKVEGTATVSDSLIAEYTASTNTLVITPTATGKLDTLETSDITEITLDTMNINHVTVNSMLTVTGTITGETLIGLHTDPAIVFTDLDSCRNVAHFNNDADVIDFTLPGAAVGLVVLFYDIGGGVITIDPVDGTDTIYLNGTSVGAGDSIDSPGNVGDFIKLMAIDATRWVTIERSGVWIDGGP